MAAIFELGTRIQDRYRLDALLGAGGMGTVYKAFDEIQGFDVALKFSVNPNNSKNRNAFLQREYSILKQFEHYAIPQAYEQGQLENGIVLFSMELIKGEPLNSLIEKQSLPDIKTRQEWLKELALVLSYIHKQGYLFCDLKPDNVMILSEAPFIKLFDFGITVPLIEGLKASDLEARGTTEYMSPEQHRGNKLEYSSDIYSFGALAFELLTGEKPFKIKDSRQITNSTQFALKYSALHSMGKIPSAHEKNPDVPKDLSSIIEVCLEKKPAERYQSADDLYECLSTADGSNVFKHFFRYITSGIFGRSTSPQT